MEYNLIIDKAESTKNIMEDKIERYFETRR